MGSFSSEDESDKGTSSYVFIVTFLIIFLIILLIKILKRLFYKYEYDKPQYVNCTCSKCKERALYQKAKLKQSNINKFLYLYIIIFLIVLYQAYICCCEIAYSSPTVRFDPYALLNITEGSTASEIKRSYKKLALQYHPDKNKDIDTKEKFMQISKAYKALSTEEGKANFLRYGDPDGPNYFRLNVSLPSFMLNKNISNIVIGVFIAFVIIILPVSFLKWFSNSKKYNEDGMMILNQSIFYYYLNENTVQTELPFILGLAMEMNTLVKVNINRELMTIDECYESYIQYMPKHSKDKIPLLNKKAICLLYSYFFRAPIAIDNYKAELNTVLSQCIPLLKYMIQMSFDCSFVSPFSNKEVKSLQKTIKTLIYFTQNLYQQGDFKAQSDNNYLLLQFPHFFSNIINSVPHYKTIKSLNELQTLSKEERKEMLNKTKTFSKETIDDILIALDNIPQYEIKLDSKIETFQLNNSIAFEGKIVLKNVNKDKQLGLRHSISYMEAFNDELIVLISLDGKIIDCKVIPVTKIESSFKFAMLTADGGNLNYNVEVYSLNYKGIDQTFAVPLVSTLPKRDMSKYIRNLSQSKIEYFNDMYKQPIPYVEYEDAKEETDEEKAKTKGKPKTD